MDGVDGSSGSMTDLQALEVLRRYGVSPIAVTPRHAVHVIVHPRLRLSLNGAPSTTQDVDLEREIDTSNWLSGVLLVRLQAKTTWAAGTSITVLARRVSVVDDGSSTLFNGGTLAFVQILSTATAPSFSVAGFTLPITTQTAITVRLTQPATTRATSVELGIELIGRTAARLAPGVRLPSVMRPRSGIVENKEPVIYREPWGARAISSKSVEGSEAWNPSIDVTMDSTANASARPRLEAPQFDLSMLGQPPADRGA